VSAAGCALLRAAARGVSRAVVGVAVRGVSKAVVGVAVRGVSGAVVGVAVRVVSRAVVGVAVRVVVWAGSCMQLCVLLSCMCQLLVLGSLTPDSGMAA
jgi:hypothetical protein